MHSVCIELTIIFRSLAFIALHSASIIVHATSNSVHKPKINYFLDNDEDILDCKKLIRW